MNKTLIRRYSALRGDPALGHLCHALLEAVDQDCPEWWDALGDPRVLEFGQHERQTWWDNLSSQERGRWLTGQLWNCGDVLPSAACQTLAVPPGSTYAQAARLLRAELG